MSKFSIGDRVKSTEKCAHNGAGEIGTVRYVCHYIGVEWDNDVWGHDGLGEYICKNGHGWNVMEHEIERINGDQKIIITHDNHTTLARLYEGDKVIKSAEAKCMPTDTFDFLKEGAKRAFARLIEDEKQDKPIEKPIKLYCVKSNHDLCKLTKGKIYEFINGGLTYDDGYETSCDINPSYKAWVTRNDDITSCLVPLISRPAKEGESVYVVDSDKNPNNQYKNGDVVKAIRVYEKYIEHTTDGNIMYHKEYLVLDGYKPEPEKCKCCGQIIKE